MLSPTLSLSLSLHLILLNRVIQSASLWLDRYNEPQPPLAAVNNDVVIDCCLFWEPSLSLHGRIGFSGVLHTPMRNALLLFTLTYTFGHVYSLMVTSQRTPEEHKISVGTHSQPTKTLLWTRIEVISDRLRTRLSAMHTIL